MSEIREIVTKAVVAKGKKLFRINELVPLTETAEKILGCWIVNNEITTELLENKVKINGSFEINIWYAYDEKIYKCSKYKIYAETQSDLYKTCQLPDIKSIARVVSYMIGDKGDKND